MSSSLTAQMKMRDREMVPRFAVQLMFALMIVSLAIVSFATVTGRPHVGVAAPSPIAQEVSLRLQGNREGNVVVYDDAGRIVARSEEDLQGFIGVVWRVMARVRLVHGLPDTAPIRLVRRENGHIEIIDPSTDWSFPLIGYGADNVAAFARLID